MRFRTRVELGGMIAELREGRGLSQRSLAAEVDMDQSAVSRIEAGRRDIGAQELYLLAEALGTNAEALLTEEDREPALLRASDAEDVEIANAHRDFETAVDDYFAVIALAEYL